MNPAKIQAAFARQQYLHRWARLAVLVMLARCLERIAENRWP